MPYESGALDMYEWFHSVPYEKSNLVLLETLNIISEFHQETMSQSSERDELLLLNYLQDKVISNCENIRSLLESFFNLDKFYINGEEFSFDEWRFLFNVIALRGMFKNICQSEIHGDLTIDNLIMRPGEKWMIIDPNPTSGYKNPLMDWGKLLQSLNKGYEFLNRNDSCRYDQDSIQYVNHSSHLYHLLHKDLINEIKMRFGNDALREARIHEIIHYLRLLPYKFARSEKGGMLFFGVTCKLIREFREEYGIS
jgi:hypothetical protein